MTKMSRILWAWSHLNELQICIAIYRLFIHQTWSEVLSFHQGLSYTM